jgi:hypothetical protein
MGRGARVIPDILAIAAGVEPRGGEAPGRHGGLTIAAEGGKDHEHDAGRRDYAAVPRQRRTLSTLLSTTQRMGVSDLLPLWHSPKGHLESAGAS